MLFAMCGANPAVKYTAAVSPTIRPILRIIAIRIPGSALGKTTLNCS